LAQARGLDGIQRELDSLRREVVGYRMTHTHETAQLDRRLDALEEATAHAVNEVRMASDQISARLPIDPGRRADHG
jgi:transposase InsO family protein